MCGYRRSEWVQNRHCQCLVCQTDVNALRHALASTMTALVSESLIYVRSSSLDSMITCLPACLYALSKIEDKEHRYGTQQHAFSPSINPHCAFQQQPGKLNAKIEQPLWCLVHHNTCRSYIHCISASRLTHPDAGQSGCSSTMISSKQDISSCRGRDILPLAYQLLEVYPLTSSVPIHFLLLYSQKTVLQQSNHFPQL